MTDGTSQGLFIVVAIVIFGIFTLMAYILFEDTLSPALIGLFGDATEKASEGLYNYNIGTWIWETSHIVTKPEEVLNVLVEKGVKTVYLQVNRDIEMIHYRSFIASAKKKGINVQALSGSPDWVSTSDYELGWQLQEDFYEWLTLYQKDSSRSQRFTGIHLDIEPHALSNSYNWENDKQNTILFYQQSIDFALEQAKELNMDLILDIPFWFDEETFDNDYGTGNIYEWLLTQNVTELAIMAFRDTADGTNSILDLTRNELEKSKNSRVNLSFSVETQDLGEDNLSFAEEGEAYMSDELRKVKDTVKKYKNFRGFSIHHFDSWELLSK